MENKQVFISVCSQKGGVGKSTFTVLLASWLHYVLGREVLVVDCDVPQSSIYALRERELETLEHSDYHKLMMIRQFKQTGRKIWPVIESTPEKGLADAERFIAQAERPIEIVLFDMPGTVGTSEKGGSRTPNYNQRQSSRRDQIFRVCADTVTDK